MTLEWGFTGLVFLVSMSFVAKAYNQNSYRTEKLIEAMSLVQSILSRKLERDKFYRQRSIEVMEKSNHRQSPISDFTLEKMKAMAQENDSIEKNELKDLDKIIKAISPKRDT